MFHKDEPVEPVRDCLEVNRELWLQIRTQLRGMRTLFLTSDVVNDLVRTPEVSVRTPLACLILSDGTYAARLRRAYRYCLLTHCPIFSVPNVPMPFRRKAKTKRFSFRRPTLKLKAWAVTMQHFQV